MSRYAVHEGIVIRRMKLPSGDLVATLLSEHGKWRGVARKGTLPGGNIGRLSLFHDVTVQHYRRRDDDLPVLVQVQLNGALPHLSDPEVYPYAHLLAELADQLTVDVHIGEPMHAFLASGLRGLAGHHDPDAVALAYAWALLRIAGLAPGSGECARCGDTDRSRIAYDVPAGGMLCEACAADGGGIVVGAAEIEVLEALVQTSLRRALRALGAPGGRAQQWRLLGAHLAYHVGTLRSARHLPDLERSSPGASADAGASRVAPATEPGP